VQLKFRLETSSLKYIRVVSRAGEETEEFCAFYYNFGVQIRSLHCEGRTSAVGM
jgi:hypothetical protein